MSKVDLDRTCQTGFGLSETAFGLSETGFGLSETGFGWSETGFSSACETGYSSCETGFKVPCQTGFGRTSFSETGFATPTVENPFGFRFPVRFEVTVIV